ncbi:MAG: hypothetical protein V7603_5039 [Micromonosporaceae bacterium]
MPQARDEGQNQIKVKLLLAVRERERVFAEHRQVVHQLWCYLIAALGNPLPQLAEFTNLAPQEVVRTDDATPSEKPDPAAHVGDTQLTVALGTSGGVHCAKDPLASAVAAIRLVVAEH